MYKLCKNGFIITPMIPSDEGVCIKKKGSKPMYDILNSLVVKPRGKISGLF